MVALKEITQHLGFAGFIGSAIALMGSTVFSNNSILASLSTLSGTVSLYTHLGIERSNDRNRLQKALEEKQQAFNQLDLELRRSERSLNEIKVLWQEALSTLKRFQDESGQLIDIASLRSNLSHLQQRLTQTSDQLVSMTGERESLKLEVDRLSSQITSFDVQKRHWVQRFDQIVLEHEKETEELAQTVSELERENFQFKAKFENVDEMAKLRAERESRALQDKLEELRLEYNKLVNDYENAAGLYNSLRSEHLAKTAEFRQEFEELNDAVNKGLPEAFDAVLDERDRELLKLSGLVQDLSRPRKFEGKGEYTRADQLIDLLYQSDHQVILDAMEIVPDGEKGRFKAFYWLRGNAGGTLTAKALNDLSEGLAEQLFCIEPIKFECDLQNPHRIGASFIYRRVKQTKDAIAKLWKTADQFAAIAGKWSRIRVTGGSESGKSPLAEMIAGAIQQNRPKTQIALAFPKQNSKKNHWGLPVSYSGWKGCLDAAKEARELMEARDRGEVESSFFYAPIIDEADTTLSSYPEIAAEIKAVMKSGSHNGVGIIVLGQNANVRQWKGYDRSDFENVVNVHIGSNAKHAIENSNLSEAEKRKLKESADKLTTHCEAQNEGIEDEDIKIRFALVLEPNKQGFFIEIPRFGSIVYDNYKASNAESFVPVKEEFQSTLCCPDCASIQIKKDGKNKQGTLQFHKCKDCRKRFPQTL